MPIILAEFGLNFLISRDAAVYFYSPFRHLWENAGLLNKIKAISIRESGRQSLFTFNTYSVDVYFSYCAPTLTYNKLQKVHGEPSAVA